MPIMKETGWLSWFLHNNLSPKLLSTLELFICEYALDDDPCLDIIDEWPMGQKNILDESKM